MIEQYVVLVSEISPGANERGLTSLGLRWSNPEDDNYIITDIYIDMSTWDVSRVEHHVFRSFSLRWRAFSSARTPVQYRIRSIWLVVT